MAATLAGVSFTATTVISKAGTNNRTIKSPCLNRPWSRMVHQLKRGRMSIRTMAAPESLSNKVEDSIKNAEEVCAGDPVSGECVAAWDEVEEVSAAASDERLKKKQEDPLETYCNDNPETDECRTYDN